MLKGYVRVAQSTCGGEGQAVCTAAGATTGNLFGLYLEAGREEAAAVVKLAGSVSVDPVTGQLTARFTEDPQLPFSDLKVSVEGGANAPLANPQSCGTFATIGELEPWSAPDSGSNAHVSDSFQIDNGCVSGFAAAFTAGTTNNQVGAYSPFTLTFSRQDGEQTLGRVSVMMPPGLLGRLAGVGECSEADIALATNNPSGVAEAASPSCPANSLIGTVTVGAGAGPDPYYVTGSVYLTGPYKGGPFGLSVVVPVLAGPFNLGTVVVRSSLHIDPHTAQVTVISDPFPTILQGIPIRLRSVNVTIDRPNFTLNPTNCAPMAVTGTITSTQGAIAPVSSRFQVGDCAGLTFAPKFAVSTSGKASKRNGASLNVKLTFPHSGPQSGNQSGEANVKSVKVKLPSALPARLTTLQKACTEKQFAENPAGCPKASLVGMAIAHTPILSVPLQGPVYLVSHGGAAFPDVVMILQGEGIVIDLVGNTEIKGQVTTSTFASVPDAPVSSFELKLPEGEFSALSANGNLCTQKLVMPTEFVAQNGATLSQNTHIEVEGCEFVVKVKSGKSRRREPRRQGIQQVRKYSQKRSTVPITGPPVKPKRGRKRWMNRTDQLKTEK